MSVYETSPVKRFRRTKAQLAAIDDAIITAVREDAPVTLRGVFYRVVSAGAVDKTDAGYNLVSRQLLKLRRGKVVPYAYIVDGTRTTLVRKGTWTDVDEMLEDAAVSYRRQLWNDQDSHVNIFSEKDAISGVIWPVCERWHVPLGIVRGYSSETFAWSVSEDILYSNRQGKDVYLYQLGDHDPSGVDAWRSFEERVRGFLGEAGYMSWLVHFERVAVTPDQIQEHGLPTRPTKHSDTRSNKFSGESVEVDAMPAPILRRIVEEAIVQHIDEHALGITRMAEAAERELLTGLAGLAG